MNLRKSAGLQVPALEGVEEEEDNDGAVETISRFKNRLVAAAEEEAEEELVSCSLLCTTEFELAKFESLQRLETAVDSEKRKVISSSSAAPPFCESPATFVAEEEDDEEEGISGNVLRCLLLFGWLLFGEPLFLFFLGEALLFFLNVSPLVDCLQFFFTEALCMRENKQHNNERKEIERTKRE